MKKIIDSVRPSQSKDINIIKMQPAKAKEFIPVSTVIHRIECSPAWQQLEKRERMYAYYLTRASWEGCKVTWFQTSYESPALLVLLKLMFG